MNFSGFQIVLNPPAGVYFISIAVLVLLAVLVILFKQRKSAFIFLIQLILTLMILLFILRPELKIKSGVPVNPEIAVLLDDSKSMLNLIAGKKSRLESAKTIIDLLKQNQIDFKIYNFSDFKTESGFSALNELEKNANPENTFLAVFSDFNADFGTLADYEKKKFNGINFHCVDSEPLNFVNLAEALYEKNESKDGRLKFNLKIQVYLEGVYSISLFERNKLIAVKNLNASTAGSHEISFEYESKNNSNPVLFFKFKISSKTEQTENIVIDNEICLALENNVKKNKILLVSGNSDWDFAFFNRILSKYESVETDYYFQNLKNLNPSLSSYSDNYNLVILFKPNLADIPDKILNSILKINGGKSVVLYFTGSFEKIFGGSGQIQNLFRFIPKKNISKTNLVLKQFVQKDGLFLPVMNLNDYPPLDSMLKLSPGPEYIHYICDASDSSPLLFEIKGEKLSAIVFTGSGFYKWQFNQGIMSENSGEFAYLWNSVLTYLLNKSAKDEILIKPLKSKYIYERFENSEFDVILSENLKNNFKDLKLTHYAENKTKNEIRFVKDSLDNFLPTDSTGLNRIEASLSVTNLTRPVISSFEYAVDYSSLEKNSNLKIERVKSQYFKNQDYYNFSDSDSFVKKFKTFIKPRHSHLTLKIAQNPYFLSAFIIIFCFHWFLLKYSK